MKWKNILLVLALWVVAGACEKKEIPMFTTDDAGIYFQRVTSYIYGSTTENYGDSVAYSFVSAQATAKSVVLSATVRTMTPKFFGLILINSCLRRARSSLDLIFCDTETLSLKGIRTK